MPADCEIVSTRVVEFPVETVFRAWAEAEHLKNWWGPKGFTNTFDEFDFRVGGKWVFTMHGPERGNYPNECVFVKISKPNLIVWNRISKPIFQVQFFFENLSEEKTKITFKMVFTSAEECAKIVKFAPEKNEENFDKLEAELSKMQQKSAAP